MRSIDVVDIKKAVKEKKLYFYIENGFILCKDLVSQECVKVGEIK